MQRLIATRCQAQGTDKHANDEISNPVKIKKVKGGYRVSTPSGVKAKSTSKIKAERQKNLLNAIEHSNWKPTGKKARK